MKRLLVALLVALGLLGPLTPTAPAQAHTIVNMNCVDRYPNYDYAWVYIKTIGSWSYYLVYYNNVSNNTTHYHICRLLNA